MATYVFKAMDITGAKATGEVDAESKQVVSDQLKSRGLIALDIADKHASKEIKLSFLEKIKAGDLTIMTRQLATMVSSGMTILRALYVLEAQTDSKPLAEVIVKVRKDVEAGLPLSDALERHPKVFSSLFVAMTRAGETGGLLEDSLMRSADQLEKEESLRLKIPMQIGDIVQKVALARWSRTLSALVSAGVPLLAALDITAKTAGNRVIENAMADVIESVKRGGTIADPLKKYDVFPGMVSHMVSVGEETGAMDQMLSKIADFYEDQVAAAVKSLTSILEPVMLVVVGGIVGFIVISMYLPLFKVYDSIK